MIVCVCHRVSDRDIARAAQAGCASFDELQVELSVATCCGKCHAHARETFHHHAAQALQQRAGGAPAQPGMVIPIAATAPVAHAHAHAHTHAHAHAPGSRLTQSAP